MDRQYIDDHHIVPRYLADQLSDEEREAFEAYYLEHPEVVQEMETVARLKVGMMDLQRSGDLASLMRGRRRLPTSRFVMAAAAVLVAIGIVFFVNRDVAPVLLAARAESLQSNQSGALRVTSPQRIFRVRGSDADAEIELPATQQAIALEILPESAGTSFRLSLSRVDGTDKTMLAEANNLPLNVDGFVPAYLDSAAIEPGLYELELTNEASPADAASQFSLRVRRN